MSLVLHHHLLQGMEMWEANEIVSKENPNSTLDKTKIFGILQFRKIKFYLIEKK